MAVLTVIIFLAIVVVHFAKAPNWKQDFKRTRRRPVPAERERSE
jgi:hypothetical protein